MMHQTSRCRCASPTSGRSVSIEARKAHSSNNWHVNVGSLLVLIVGVFAVASALLARHGFTGRDHVVGIDLGTTYSVVAIAQHNNVSVIPDASGYVLVPSIVAFVTGGETLVGRSACGHRTRDPRHTIFNAKRFIGRTFDAVKHSNDDTAYEFRVSPDASSNPNSVCFALALPGHPPCVSPIAVGAAIVRHLRAMAQSFVGHNQITKAVIAVPVDFDAVQRRATQQAFEAAGLQVSRMLDEPTAAAIAYGLHQDAHVSFIVVFDFGGGTLDVSLLFTRAGSISVVDTIGDSHLGGEDIDARLAAFLTTEIATQIRALTASTTAPFDGQERTDSRDGTHDGDDPSVDLLPCTVAGIRRAAELLKRTLSDVETATATCVVQRTHTDSQVPVGARVAIQVTRQQLEHLCIDLFERTLSPVQEIIAMNHMTPDEIDAVVLVGGSSRIPYVRQQLTALFHGRAPLATIDPDVAVAIGAARVVD